MNTLFLVIFANVLVQALSFLFQPILSRLYAPVFFGDFAQYQSIISVIVPIILLGLDQAIYASNDNASKQNIIFFQKFEFLSAFFIMLMVFAIIVLYNSNYSLLIIPFLCIFEITNTVILALLYKEEARVKIILFQILRALSIGLLQIYFSRFTQKGLLWGYLFGISIVNLLFIRIFWLSPSLKIQLKVFFHRYKKYIFFQMPSSFVNHFTFNSIILIIPILFSKSDLGYYSLINRVLTIPISFISMEVRKLLIVNLSKTRDKNHTKKTFWSYFLFLTLLSLFFLPLCFYGEKIFIFVFGNMWSGIGIMLKAVIISYVFRFILFPFSGVFIIKNNHEIQLFFQAFLLLGFFILFTMVAIFDLSFISFLHILSWYIALIYLIQFIVSYYWLFRPVSRHVRNLKLNSS